MLGNKIFLEVILLKTMKINYDTLEILKHCAHTFSSLRRKTIKKYVIRGIFFFQTKLEKTAAFSN